MKKAIIGVIIAAVVAGGGFGIYKMASSSSQDKTLQVSAQEADKTTQTTEAAATTTPATTDSHAAATETLTPEQAIAKLKAGNERFVNDKSEVTNVDSATRKTLEAGQHPFATVVACSDSRVTPTTVFNQGLGQIFDVRLAGDVVDDSALGSIEYAVDHLHTPVVVVMGHEKCGAVTAAYDQVVKGEQAHGHIEDLVDEIKPAISKDGTVDDAIRKNVVNVVNEIKADPIVAQAIKEGKVQVVGAYYDLEGHVTFSNN